MTCLCTAQTIEDAISNPGSVGRLYPCLEAKIVDEDFQPAKIGEPGELCIRGATVMKYFSMQDDGLLKTDEYVRLSSGVIGATTKPRKPALRLMAGIDRAISPILIPTDTSSEFGLRYRRM